MTTRPSRMTAMLSISDVVDLLGVSDKTIRRLIKAKKLSCQGLRTKEPVVLRC